MCGTPNYAFTQNISATRTHDANIELHLHHHWNTAAVTIITTTAALHTLHCTTPQPQTNKQPDHANISSQHMPPLSRRGLRSAAGPACCRPSLVVLWPLGRAPPQRRARLRPAVLHEPAEERPRHAQQVRGGAALLRPRAWACERVGVGMCAFAARAHAARAASTPTLSSPAAMARILSEKMMVSNRCAMVTVVRSWKARRMVRCACMQVSTGMGGGGARWWRQRGLGWAIQSTVRLGAWSSGCIGLRLQGHASRQAAPSGPGHAARALTCMSASVCRSMAAVASSSSSTRVRLSTHRAMHTFTQSGGACVRNAPRHWVELWRAVGRGTSTCAHARTHALAAMRVAAMLVPPWPLAPAAPPPPAAPHQLPLPQREVGPARRHGRAQAPRQRGHRVAQVHEAQRAPQLQVRGLWWVGRVRGGGA